MTSPTRISDVVNNFLEERKKEVTKDLSFQYSEGRRFTLITDEWSASNGPRYVNIILKSESTTNLGLVRVLGSLTSSAIVTILSNKLKQFHVDLKNIVAITSDGCSTMVKVGKDLLASHGVFQQICLAHGIHLAATDIIYNKKTGFGYTNSEIIEEIVDELDRDDDAGDTGTASDDPTFILNNFEQEMIVEDEEPDKEANEEDLGERYLVMTEPEDEVVDILSEFSSTLDKARGIYNFYRYDRRNQILQVKILLKYD